MYQGARNFMNITVILSLLRWITGIFETKIIKKAKLNEIYTNNDNKAQITSNIFEMTDK